MPPPATLLQLLIIGLTNGAVIALNAIAVTVVYGTVRSLNLAHGDVFALATIVVTSLVAALGLSLASPAPLLLAGLVVALAGAVAAAVGLNTLVERAAFRPFRTVEGGRSRLAPLVATLGLSFVLYQISLVWRYFLPNWLPGEHRSVPGVPELPRDRIPEVLPDLNLTAGLPVTFTLKEAWVLAAAVAAAVAVHWVLQRTRLGRGLRAVAQNVELARIVGVNPEVVIGQAFGLGGALAGLAAFVFATYYTRPFANAGAQSGLIALAAAILGGLGNPLGALGSGLLLGVLAAFSDYGLDARWTPVLLQVVLIALLVARPGVLGGEDQAVASPGAEADALGAGGAVSAGWRRLAVGLLVLGLAYPWLDQAFGLARLSTMTSVVIYGLLATGLNMLLGWAGILDLGYAVSFGVGGFVAAWLTTTADQRLDFWLVAGLSGAAAGLVGAFNGRLTRRLRSDELAIVTLALGQIARGVLVNLGGLAGNGGSLAAVPPPHLFGLALHTPVARYYLALAVLALVLAAGGRLVGSRVGRAWRAGGADEAAAASQGIDVGRYRTLAFVVSAAVAGVAGALYASAFTYIDPEAVDFRLSAMALAMVILGGAGNLTGVVLGAVVLAGYDQWAIPLLGEWLASFQSGDARLGSALDARGLSYLNFGLALYLTVWWRARRRRP